MAQQASPYARSYNSFSGTDIKAVFGSAVVGELQAISYSITREKGPVYTMGSPNPRAFARGKRGIAGTLIFIMFDQSGMMSAMKNMNMQFFADNDELVPGSSDLWEGPTQGTNFDDLALTKAFGDAAGNPIPGSVTALGGASVSTTNVLEGAGIGLSGNYRPAWYADQVPPFDITLAAANEYGAIAVMKVWGVETLNEGYGVSIDDIVSEEQMTYVARDVTKWFVVENPDPRQLYAGAK
ncbi:MAG: hypothetical protein KJ569_08175 [Candidatus Omnitrophica bacterium]|nr:hypothetical protein [Candidatus Omnitrophota bacterium]